MIRKKKSKVDSQTITEMNQLAINLDMKDRREEGRKRGGWRSDPYVTPY